MTTSLEKYLIERIRAQGPLSIAQFMAIALAHPQHGYYMKQDPFGRSGDFTTAPEISQMFGEIIGAWTADLWRQMGSPVRFNLVECGPGRGTLMADLLRATRNVTGFHAACHVHLLEISLVLKEKQKETLAGYGLQWHETLDSVPADKPVILIANEFLDALPIQQFVQTDGGWQERVVTLNENQDFEFFPVSSGEIIESSPARSFFMDQVCALLEKVGGAALFIDYGSTQSGSGDTLQAVHKHKPVPVLEKIGDADITSHVDFEALAKQINREKFRLRGPVTQGEFLRRNGIAARGAQLSLNADAAQKADIENSLKRLTNSDQMGTLFKVMGIDCGKALKPAGFKSA